LDFIPIAYTKLVAKDRCSLGNCPLYIKKWQLQIGCFYVFRRSWTNLLRTLKPVKMNSNIICGTNQRQKQTRLPLRVSFFLLSIVAGSSCLAQPTEKQVRETLYALMQKEHIPGLAYAVVKNGKIEMEGVLGKADLAFDQNVTKQTVFQLASCSKIYCSLLLGKLFDNHLLRPSQKLGELIDSIPMEWKDITLLQLAAHQSGIKIGDFSKAGTSQKALEIALKMPMIYQPGTRDGYVSSDYWILEYIIEKVTGLKYFSALKKYVLNPLSLTHTFVNNPKIGMISGLDILPQQTQEYHWFKTDSILRISQMWFDASGYTAGGIYSSIQDVAQVATLFDRGDFLSPETKELISHPVMLLNGKPGSFGLGLIVKDYQGHKIIEHSGGPALADFVRFDKEKITFIVLTNNRGVYPYLAKTLATMFIAGLTRPTIPAGWE
jgi:D-alanyl-D-alanine carboxypeptidase